MGHLKKALDAIEVTFDVNTRVVKLVQSTNDCAPIVVNALEKVTFFKLLHSDIAFSTRVVICEEAMSMVSIAVR